MDMGEVVLVFVVGVGLNALVLVVKCDGGVVVYVGVVVFRGVLGNVLIEVACVVVKICWGMGRFEWGWRLGGAIGWECVLLDKDGDGDGCGGGGGGGCF